MVKDRIPGIDTFCDFAKLSYNEMTSPAHRFLQAFLLLLGLLSSLTLEKIPRF